MRRRALLLICGLSSWEEAYYLYTTSAAQVVVAGITLPLDDRQQFDTTLDMLEEHILKRLSILSPIEQVWEVTGRSLGVRLDRVAMWERAGTMSQRRPLRPLTARLPY